MGDVIRTRGSIWRYGWLAFCLCLLGQGCRPSPPATRAAAEISIHFTCDVHGRLEPCGCFTGQYGGVSRLKTILSEPKSFGGLRLDVGDAIGGAEDFDLVAYRYLLKAFQSMHFDALNVGAREAQLGAESLRSIAESSPVPIISANVIDTRTGKPVVAEYKILERFGYRLAVIGVLDPKVVGDSLGPNLRVESMESTLLRLVPDLNRQCDTILLLAFTDEATLASLADQFYEVSVILGGKVAQPSQKLEKRNRSYVYFTTNESRALGILRLRITGKGAAAVTFDEIRLLNDKIPQDPEITGLAEAYRVEIRKTDLKMEDPAFLNADAVPGVRLSAQYTGSQTCSECHPTAARIWNSSGHAHAMEALRRRQSDADPKCIGCHTVGFGRNPGFQRRAPSDIFANVGCESCHGPGSLHVRMRRGEGSVAFQFRPVGPGDCQTCHYGEFSRPFDWASFWPAIQHGKEPSLPR